MNADMASLFWFNEVKSTQFISSMASTFTTQIKPALNYQQQSNFYTRTGGSIQFFIPPFYSFTTFQFTTLSTSGATGPTSLAGYGTSYPGYGTPQALALSGGIQYWTVPSPGKYSFTFAGAGSVYTGSTNAVKIGNGAVLTVASYALNKGNILAILVGQQGTDANAGGGTFVVSVSAIGGLSGTPLFVAGGAGGLGGEPNSGANGNVDASLNTTGKNGQFGAPTTAGSGGTGGSGGTVATNNAYNFGDAGAGYYGNGAWGGQGSSANVPKAFVNGGTGGTNNGSGGFGGGAAFGTYRYREGGGGGGYSGGGNGGSDAYGCGGGGGGSYDITGTYSGTATNTGDGYVTITKV